MLQTGEINRLSAVLQLNEGITIPGLSEIIIMHSYSGNSAKAAQRIGRTLGLSPDQTSTIHILCYEGTADEKWITNTLESFDQSKITYKQNLVKI